MVEYRIEEIEGVLSDEVMAQLYDAESRRGWQMLQVAMWLGLAEVCGLAYWLLW